MSLVAITRPVSSSIESCELTKLKRQKININLARKQHRQYEQILVDLGIELHRLPIEETMPDSVFIEDTAVVLDELAIMTRPGAESRRTEINSVAKKLESYRQLFFIQPPGTMDGGDILHINNTMFVGLSGRANPDGFKQLQTIVQPFGYKCTSVRVRDCLHLKSSMCLVAKDPLLINRRWIDVAQFRNFTLIEVDEAEPYAGNALLVTGTLIYPLAFPKTRVLLERRGIEVKTINLSELAKAEGGVTCCSLIFKI